MRVTGLTWSGHGPLQPTLKELQGVSSIDSRSCVIAKVSQVHRKLLEGPLEAVRNLTDVSAVLKESLGGSCKDLKV